MDYQSWIEGIDGLASLYSFDILPDGSFSEIRLIAVNKQNEGMLHYGDEITLKAEVRDANMNYHLVWEASDNDGRGWYAVGSGERYSFFLNRENAGREYRVSVIAVD